LRWLNRHIHFGSNNLKLVEEIGVRPIDIREQRRQLVQRRAGLNCRWLDHSHRNPIALNDEPLGAFNNANENVWEPF
jgi:hypothetical protein